MSKGSTPIAVNQRPLHQLHFELAAGAVQVGHCQTDDDISTGKYSIRQLSNFRQVRHGVSLLVIHAKSAAWQPWLPGDR